MTEKKKKVKKKKKVSELSEDSNTKADEMALGMWRETHRKIDCKSMKMGLENRLVDQFDVYLFAAVRADEFFC